MTAEKEMWAFLSAVAAAIVIAVITGVVFDQLGMSTAEFYLAANTRL